jgi:hypothetical protein
LDGITTIRFDTVASLLGDQGWGDDPAAVAFLDQIAIELIAAGTSFVDKDKRLAFRLQLPEELVDITLARPDRAKGDDFGAICLGHISDCDGLLMHIHADVERVRVMHG